MTKNEAIQKAMRLERENAQQRKDLEMQVADNATGKVVRGLSEDDFAQLYRSSRMELRLHFDRTHYSRLQVIAPNPATAWNVILTFGVIVAILANVFTMIKKPSTAITPDPLAICVAVRCCDSMNCASFGGTEIGVNSQSRPCTSGS